MDSKSYLQLERLQGEGEIQDYKQKMNIGMIAHHIDSAILLGSNPNIYEAQCIFEPKNSQ